MRRALQATVEDFATQLDGLCSVVISAVPDGLLVWAWAKAGMPAVAQEFAGLARSANSCLRALAADDGAMSLSLVTDQLRIFSWPLDIDGFGLAKRDDPGPTQGLIVNAVFSNEVLPGMASVHSLHLGRRLRAVLEEEGLFEVDELREAMVAVLLEDRDPLALLERMAATAGVEIEALAQPRSLSVDQRGDIAALLDIHMNARAEAAARVDRAKRREMS